MSTSPVSPMKSDIVLTLKGHRRLWDGRRWCVLYRKKKDFTQMEFKKFKSITYSV
jgi:hypothetical protein